MYSVTRMIYKGVSSANMVLNYICKPVINVCTVMRVDCSIETDRPYEYSTVGVQHSDMSYDTAI